MLKYLVAGSIDGLSTEADYQAIEKFYSDKDISKYNLSLAQTQEGIRAKITWLEVGFITPQNVYMLKVDGSARLAIFVHGCRNGSKRTALSCKEGRFLLRLLTYEIGMSKLCYCISPPPLCFLLLYDCLFPSHCMSTSCTSCHLIL